MPHSNRSRRSPSRGRSPRAVLVAPVLVAPVLAMLALLVAAAPAGAATWTVELENGHRFETAYQPEVASWDSGLVLLLSSEGNHIALRRDDIASVRADVEVQGFGTMIDSKTISLGVAPDHLAPPGTEAATPESPEMQMLRAMIDAQQPAPQQNVNVEQFVDPGQAGFAGVPAGGIVTGGAPATPLGGPGPGPFAAPGIVTAPPSTSVPAQGSTVPAQGSTVPLQTAPPTGQ